MTIYLEGGGSSDGLKTECRKAFTKFFEATGLKESKRMPGLVACGSRNEAFDKFSTAVRNGKETMLLVDSEAPVEVDATTSKPISPWVHLKRRDGWACPPGAHDGQVQLMVECMESWFAADRDQFIAYYSAGNRRANSNAIPNIPNVEVVTKQQIFSYLEAASLPSGKNKYSKGSRSFEILGIMRPEAVARVSYHARRLFYYLGVNESWLDRSEFDDE